MPDTEGHFLLELFRARLLKEVQSDLGKENEESVALRKAMLALIMMTQDGAGRSGKKFIEYLLTEFPPLAGRFAAAPDHPIFGKHSVGRRRSLEEGVVLSLNRKLVDSMLKKPVNAREMALIGNLVPWEMTAERYVAFYDIMGFRSFVERHQGDHGVLHRMMSELHDIAVRAEEMHPHGGAKLHPALGHRGSQLRIVQFSDTILAMTRDASGTAGLLIQLVSQMFFLHALRLGTVLRGAIARGTVTADFEKSIFFGQTIVDAYLLEENQAWYGIAEHASVQSAGAADAATNEKLRPLQKGEIPLTVPYGVPLKASGTT